MSNKLLLSTIAKNTVKRLWPGSWGRNIGFGSGGSQEAYWLQFPHQE